MFTFLLSYWNGPDDEQLTEARVIAEELLNARAKAYPLIVHALLEPIQAISKARADVSNKDPPPDIHFWNIKRSVDGLLSVEAIVSLLSMFPGHVREVYKKYKMWRSKDELLEYIKRLRYLESTALSLAWAQALIDLYGDYSWYSEQSRMKFDPSGLKLETHNMVRDFIENYRNSPNVRVCDACAILLKAENAVKESRKMNRRMWAIIDREYQKKLDDHIKGKQAEISKRQGLADWRNAQNKFLEEIDKACGNGSNNV